MQRNFEPMRKQVEAWQRCELTDVTAKVVIYEAFVEGKTRILQAPGQDRARPVFRAEYEEFKSRTIWSLSNAFHIGFQGTGADSVNNSTAKLGEFLDARFSQSV